VCNLSLIMGVAGAAGEDPHSIVIAGVAGLLAGGFSMAVGEYVSVRSQRELLDYQIELQRHQLHNTPEQERDILREIYEAKGLSRRRVGPDRQSDHEGPGAGDRHLRARGDRAFGRDDGLAGGRRARIALGAFAVGRPSCRCCRSCSSRGQPRSPEHRASGVALFAIGIGVSRLTHRHAIWTGIRQAAGRTRGRRPSRSADSDSLLGTAVH
jgi:hypothetical protein